MFITRMITYLIRILAGVGVDDWTKVLNYVQDAESKFETGEERGEWVDGQVDNVLEYAAPFARKMLISLAVGWLNQKGIIHVNKTVEVKKKVTETVEKVLADK